MSPRLLPVAVWLLGFLVQTVSGSPAVRAVGGEDGKNQRSSAAQADNGADPQANSETPLTLETQFGRDLDAERQLGEIGDYKVLTGEFEKQSNEDPLELFNPFQAKKPRRFHGAIYEYHRNDYLDARNFFDPVDQPLPEFKRNQFGLILGAELPGGLDVIGTYEGLRIVKGSTIVSYVPPPELKGGNFGTLEQTLTDPFTGEPFPGNLIPENRIHPVSRMLLPLFPEPNSEDPSRNFVNSQPEITNRDSVSFRADFDLNDGVQVYARYEAVEESGFEATALPVFGMFQERSAQDSRVWLNRRFSMDLSAEVWVGFQRYVRGTVSEHSGEEGLLDSLGISGISVSDPLDEGYPEFEMSGYASLGESPRAPRTSVQNRYSWGGDFNWIAGEHSMRFGGSQRFYQVNNDRTGGVRRGSFYFGGSFTGDAFADFLLGIPETARRGVGVNRSDVRGRRWEAYVSDEWRIRSNFRWSTGLRYSYYRPYVSVNDSVSTYYPLLFEPPLEGAMILADSEEVRQLGFEGTAARSLIQPDRNDWAPQVGFSYNPLGSNQFVLRATYSIYYSPLDSDEFIELMTRNVPFYDLQTSQSSGSPALDLSSPFETVVPVEQDVGGIAPDLDTPSVQTWRLATDMRLSEKWSLRTSYRGAKGTGMLRTLSSNVPLPGPGVLQDRRPNPQFGLFSILSGGGSSILHSFEWDLERQLADGFSVESRFEWTRQFDDIFWGSPANPRDLRSERAVAGWIPNRRLDLRYVFDIPLGGLFEKGWLDQTVSGWRLSGVTRVQDGRYFSARMPGDPTNDGVYSDRPDRIGSGLLDSPGIDGWFEIADFSAPAEYQFGNSGRNILRSPGYHNWDISLSKRTSLADGHLLELRFQMFNAFNHPNFFTPNAVFGNSTFGKIFGASRAREIELALKYSF